MSAKRTTFDKKRYTKSASTINNNLIQKVDDFTNLGSTISYDNVAPRKISKQGYQKNDNLSKDVAHATGSNKSTAKNQLTHLQQALLWLKC